MKDKSSFTRKAIIALILIIVVSTTGAIIQNFVYTVSENEAEKADAILLKVAETNVKSVNFLFEDEADKLQLIALGLAERQSTFSQESFDFLQNAAKTLGNNNIFIDSPTGITYSKEGKELGQSSFSLPLQSDARYFLQDGYRNSASNELLINLSVPIKNNDTLLGYVRLEWNTQSLSTLIKQATNSAEGYYCLIDGMGNIVASMAEDFQQGHNFLELIKQWQFNSGYSREEIEKAFTQNNGGHTKYIHNNQEYLGYFSPLGINNWVLFTWVSKDIVLVKENFIINLAANMTLQLILIISILSAYMVYTQSKSRMYATLNEKCFRALAMQMNKVIFEWDFKKNRITSMTNFALLFGRDAVTNSSAQEAINMEMVHKDDAAAFSTIFQTILRGENVRDIRFRVKDNEGTYKWCSISGLVVRDEKGNLYKAIGSLDNIHEQVEKEEGLKEKAERDQLTGLYNKVTTEFLIKATLSGQIALQEKHALYIIDIDNFKLVNDHLGHLFGDTVLSILADELKALFRSNDIIGRIGGDEFFVFLKNFSSESLVLSKALEICKAFNKTFSDKEATCKVTASIGIALVPKHGKDFETLYKYADEALYNTKQKGKSGFTLYETENGGEYTFIE